MANGNKYLAHIVGKGVKGIFEPIILWYQDICTNSEHLVDLIQNDKTMNALVFAQTAIKPGFLSKNFEVAEWTCTLFSKLGFEFANRDLLQHAWEWFSSEVGGLNSCILCLKRHYELSDAIVSVLTKYAKYHMTELFTVNIKSNSANEKEYIITLHELLRPLMSSLKEEVNFLRKAFKKINSYLVLGY